MRRWSILLLRTMVKIISAEEFVNDERNNVKSITMMKENCNFKLDIVRNDRLIVLFIKRIIIISASRIKKHIGKK